MRKLKPKSLIAMIALRALPGSPLYDGDDQKIIDQALDDLTHYKKANVDSIAIENDGDLPYMKPPLNEDAFNLTLEICKEIRKRFEKPIGIQILENDYEASLRIAHEADLDFLRIEKYVFAHLGGAGIIEACSGPLLRLRKELNCEHIKIFTDVKKKHCSHGMTDDLDITDEVKQAEFFLVDGVIVTGKFTGSQPNIDDLKKVKSTTDLPVLIGSGMTPENIDSFFPLADGFIVGSTFRREGKFMERLDYKRLERFMKIFKKQTKTT